MKTFNAFMLLFVDFEKSMLLVSTERIRSLLEKLPFNPSGFRERMEGAFTDVQDILCTTPSNAPGRGLPSVVHGLSPVASREQNEVNTISPGSPPIDVFAGIRRIKSQGKESNTRGNAMTNPRTKVNDRKPTMLWSKEDTQCLIDYMTAPARANFLESTTHPWVRVGNDNEQLQKFGPGRLKDKWKYLEEYDASVEKLKRKRRKKSS
jgi:hypothetical protein